MRGKISIIRHEERVAFQRRQSAWEAYENTRRRFDDAYDLMLWTRDDFEKMQDELKHGHKNQILLELAEKRHKSAQEEFRYQERERRRVRAEFEAARLEHRRCHTRCRQRLAENEGGSEVMTN